MSRSTPNARHPRKSALDLGREVEMAARRQYWIECELPQELPTELTSSDKEHDPYEDIVGTC
jgi:hypothetical protein